MTTKQIIAALKRKRAEMATLRDGLRELVAEIEDEQDRATEAFDLLDQCIDRLSETV